jgi:hypothetical protein
VGNNTTGSKGKLKCASCRLSKIKVPHTNSELKLRKQCVYDASNPDDVCVNCIRRGLVCGTKLPGPKAQEDNTHSPNAAEPVAKRDEQYARLFERFQKLRPDLAPDQTEKLVEFVETGVLKEEGEQFVFSSTEHSEVGENEMSLSPPRFCGFVWLRWGRLGELWVRCCGES